MSIRWTKEQENEIIYYYLEEKIGMKSIGKKFGVSENAIKTILKHNNIAPRTIQESNGTKKYLTEEQINTIIYNYTVLHQGLQTCGKEFGYSQFLVEKLLKERGIQKRNYTESKQCSRKYSINDNYFKVQNSNMAYILGFLASDGNISKKENCITLELNREDKYILEKIAKELQCTRPIKDYITSLGKKSSKLQFWSAEIKKDLAIYNIVPDKTFTLKPPIFLKEDFYIDFIRGYFDGDGSVYIKDNKRKIIQFDGASKEMITWIRNVLNSYGITTNSLSTYLTEKGKIMYRLTYYNQEIVNNIYNLFYKDKEFFLIRKKEKFSQETSLPL